MASAQQLALSANADTSIQYSHYPPNHPRSHMSDMTLVSMMERNAHKREPTVKDGSSFGSVAAECGDTQNEGLWAVAFNAAGLLERIVAQTLDDDIFKSRSFDASIPKAPRWRPLSSRIPRPQGYVRTVSEPPARRLSIDAHETKASRWQPTSSRIPRPQSHVRTASGPAPTRALMDGRVALSGSGYRERQKMFEKIAGLTKESIELKEKARVAELEKKITEDRAHALVIAEVEYVSVLKEEIAAFKDSNTQASSDDRERQSLLKKIVELTKESSEWKDRARVAELEKKMTQDRAGELFIVEAKNVSALKGEICALKESSIQARMARGRGRNTIDSVHADVYERADSSKERERQELLKEITKLGNECNEWRGSAKEWKKSANWWKKEAMEWKEKMRALERETKITQERTDQLFTVEAEKVTAPRREIAEIEGSNIRARMARGHGRSTPDSIVGSSMDGCALAMLVENRERQRANRDLCVTRVREISVHKGGNPGLRDSNIRARVARDHGRSASDPTVGSSMDGCALAIRVENRERQRASKGFCVTQVKEVLAHKGESPGLRDSNIQARMTRGHGRSASDSAVGRKSMDEDGSCGRCDSGERQRPNEDVFLAEAKRLSALKGERRASDPGKPFAAEVKRASALKGGRRASDPGGSFVHEVKKVRFVFEL